MSSNISQQADMSAYDLKAAEIFKLILEDGVPKTSYDLIFKKDQPTATVHRHLNRMIKDNEIVMYGDGKNLRGKKPYGPTVFGFIRYYREDKEFTKNLELYFDLWKNNEIFRAGLDAMGFDNKRMEKYPAKCKKMFRSLIEYYAMAEEAYDKLAEDPYILSYEGQQFIGAMLLADNKKAKQYYLELYAFSKSFRDGINLFMLGMFQHYKELQKNSKKLMKEWE